MVKSGSEPDPHEGRIAKKLDQLAEKLRGLPLERQQELVDDLMKEGNDADEEAKDNADSGDDLQSTPRDH